ncbi:MAG: TolC family protein, partial [Bacteroidales bacterium]
EKYSEKRGRPDSLYSIQKLQLEQETARLELQTVKANSLPTLSLEAFLGANQYNQHFSPFEKHTWYGSSYVGVSFKLPILFKENFTARNKRLQLNIRILSLQEEEERSRLSTEALQSYYRIQAIRQEINRIKENKALEQQSLLILSRRFKEQQTTAFELNLEELEYLKMQTALSQKYTEEVIETLNYLQNSGLLYLLLQEPE